MNFCILPERSEGKLVKRINREMYIETYFSYLLQQYERMVYSICYRACGNPFDAQDLTQDTFLAVYKHLGTFDRQYERAWICRIVILIAFGVYLIRGKKEKLDKEPEVVYDMPLHFATETKAEASDGAQPTPDVIVLPDTKGE